MTAGAVAASGVVVAAAAPVVVGRRSAEQRTKAAGTTQVQPASLASLLLRGPRGATEKRLTRLPP